MNMQSSLIREIILYEFKLNYNATEATENIFWYKRWRRS